MRTALANSYNIPAVKLLDAVTVDRMLQGAEAFGIRSLNRGSEWYGLSLTLGGGEVTLLELTTAYAVLASEGRAVAAGADPGRGRQPRPVCGWRPAAGRRAAANNLARGCVPDNRHPQR